MAGKHVRVSAEKKSHATKRSFSSSDAKNISQQCQKIQEALNEIAKSDAIYRESIQQETNRYVATQVLKLMEKIPVEEVNRDKHGIRVKALRDSGYVTYADILTSSIYQLAAIRGISEDGARIIKRIVSEAADKASTTTKLRLSADNRTEDMTRLITAVSQYQQAKPLAEESNRLSQQYSNTIQNALEDIKVSTGTFRWLFASRQTKQNAIESYKLLEETLHGEYGQTAERLQSGSVAIEALAEDDAWDSFKKHPISYANTLEEIVPGLLGNGDTVYGLPENLAKEVQEECFFPDGLLCDLRRYQEWGVKYILHQKKALLGDEMGLGKTIQAIATMVSLRNTGATHFIVICPASVIVNWCREIQKFSKLRVIAVHGLSRESALKDWQRTGGVAVTTYETTAYFKFPDNFTYSLLVVDEAHYIKNPSTNRSKKYEGDCGARGKIAIHDRHRVGKQGGRDDQSHQTIATKHCHANIRNEGALFGSPVQRDRRPCVLPAQKRGCADGASRTVGNQGMVSTFRFRRTQVRRNGIPQKLQRHPTRVLERTGPERLWQSETSTGNH